MAKLCNRSGEPLVESGRCSHCSGKGQASTANDPEMLVSHAKQKKLQKQLERRAGREAKRAKRAAMTTGQKMCRFLLHLLALAVLVTATMCTLVHFELVDIPVISNIMEKFIRTDAVETTDFQLLQEGAISRKVTDQESARQALDDIAPQLGIKDVERELGECREDAVLGNTYYRFPQEYQGIPVYGRSVVVVADNAENGTLVSGNLTGVGRLNTKPTISFEDASEALTTFITDMPDYRKNTEVSIFPAGSSPLVIYQEKSTAHLAYAIEAVFHNTKGVNCGEFLVEANTGEVLHFSPSLYEATGYAASDTDKKNGFPVFRADDGYYLWNVDEKFYIFNLNGVESQYNLRDSWGQVLKDKNGSTYNVRQWGTGEFVFSENEVFGDTAIERNKDYEAGARLSMYTASISDFYKSFGFSNNKKIYLYYRDGYDGGKNALGGFLNSEIGVISMGIGIGVDEVDIIAHEFTHFVSRSIVVDWIGGNETSSINEALSDIFGEIIESKVTNQEIDWKNIYRNIKKPEGDCLSDYSQYNDSIDCHYASTIISHAAYLMWKGIDGSDTFEALTTEELAKLFYAMLYTLPKDCTFSQFRTLTQHTARTMNFTEKQLRCISNAFFQVGIPETELPVAKTISLEILSVDGTPDHDYTVYVRGNGTEQTYTSATVEAKGLEFPDVGSFEITVIDNAHDYIQGSRLVRVTATGGVEKLTMTIADKVKDENPSIPSDAVEFNGHRYYLYDVAGLSAPEDNTWENAQAYCEAVGGYLAAITSQEENEFLYNYMRQQGYDSAYFGLAGVNSTGTWVWCNGETVSYTNWAPGEPNNDGNGEKYGMFYWKYTDGAWNDGDFGNLTDQGGTAFLCEWEYPVDATQGGQGSITLPQIIDAMENAAAFYDGWFYQQIYVDRSDVIEANAFVIYHAVDYGGICSLEEWKNEARKFYAETIVEKFAAWDAGLGSEFHGWIEQNGKLYIAAPTGLGDNFVERYYVKLLNSSETQAEVALYIVNNWDHSLRDPYIVTCTLKNGHLVFDMVIDLPQDKPYFISYE